MVLETFVQLALILNTVAPSKRWCAYMWSQWVALS